ncbi:hypothetical protein QMK17_18565 [Rhodococcus sp. G-MC3]|uniref:hypothetical protein n=1 Tax=Rhodococcus sp. G-MC3 TaxID=3046209 RepID=UPI0024BB3093|nr:hypothetical protein [Rhodococcus sp. G-MC3]MDJ0395335.1 hypothetical protein [Rhodococcus sp. G-MC3]
MNVLEIPLSILKFQYKLVRIPLGIFEAKVVDTLDPEAPARLAYERTVGSLDKKVGSILGDSETAQRGADQVKHADDLARAVKLEAQADAAEAAADAKLRTARETAENERVAAESAAQQAAQDARATADKRKAQAAEQADEKAAADKKKADDLAASRAASAREAEAKQKARIGKVEKAAAAPAESELADAAEHQEQAEDKKAEAERIEKLFLVEKNKD